MDVDDAELVRRAQSRDRAAFEALFRRHYGWIFRLCRSYALSDADAQDLAQEVFMKAHRALPTLHDPAAFRGWLAMIGRRIGLDAVRQRGRAREVPLPDQHAETCAGQSLETQVLRNEARGLCRQIIETMPDGTPRRAATLFYLEDCEVREVARRLETSTTNVTSALSRARIWLRKHLLGQLRELRGYR